MKKHIFHKRIIALCLVLVLCICMFTACGNKSNTASEVIDGPKVTISISCATINDNIDELAKEKKALVPSDGLILAPTDVALKDGSSAFDILLQVCKDKKIHMEYSNTPVTNSPYIEGINNIYEFDCGALSGWMYKVNDWFPNYGCGNYPLKDGDVVCFEFSCDLGEDIGGGYAGGSQVDK